MTDKNTDHRAVQSRIPASLYARLEKVAAANDRTISAEIRRAILAHVETHERILQPARNLVSVHD